MTTTLLELCGWTVWRGSLRVGPLDFRVPAGSTFALMGPSGIGKTTVCLSILGFQAPDLRSEGHRRYCGRDLGEGELFPACLYIPQGFPFNPNWEVQSFLLRLPWVRNASRKERRRKVRQVLQMLGLAHRAHATAAELSGGELQRAAFAQAVLLSDTRILVADELTSGLDPGMTAEILGLFKQIVRDRCAAALLATHSADAVIAAADQVAILVPSSISSTPLMVHRGEPTWRSDWLETLLCLSRWGLLLKCDEGGPVRALGRALSSIKNRPPSPGTLEWLVLSHPSGESRPCGHDERAAIEAALPPTNGSCCYAPIRVSVNNTILLGLAAEPTSSGQWGHLVVAEVDARAAGQELQSSIVRGRL